MIKRLAWGFAKNEFSDLPDEDELDMKEISNNLNNQEEEEEQEEQEATHVPPQFHSEKSQTDGVSGFSETPSSSSSSTLLKNKNSKNLPTNTDSFQLSDDSEDDVDDEINSDQTTSIYFDPASHPALQNSSLSNRRRKFLLNAVDPSKWILRNGIKYYECIACPNHVIKDPKNFSTHLGSKSHIKNVKLLKRKVELSEEQIENKKMKSQRRYTKRQQLLKSLKDSKRSKRDRTNDQSKPVPKKPRKT